jgi:hypothetical protein
MFSPGSRPGFSTPGGQRPPALGEPSARAPPPHARRWTPPADAADPRVVRTLLGCFVEVPVGRGIVLILGMGPVDAAVPPVRATLGMSSPGRRSPGRLRPALRPFGGRVFRPRRPGPGPADIIETMDRASSPKWDRSWTCQRLWWGSPQTTPPRGLGRPTRPSRSPDRGRSGRSSAGTGPGGQAIPSRLCPRI